MAGGLVEMVLLHVPRGPESLSTRRRRLTILNPSSNRNFGSTAGYVAVLIASGRKYNHDRHVENLILKVLNKDSEH